MVQIVEQLCIKSFEITAQNGDHWKAEQGKTYTTTVPDDHATVVVFSRYWVPVPKEHFVIRERDMPAPKSRRQPMTELTERENCRVTVTTSARYIPPFPERTAYHWIRRFRGGPAIPLWWCAEWHKNGRDGWGKWAQPDRENQWEYCGPCPSPDDVVQPQGDTR